MPPLFALRLFPADAGLAADLLHAFQRRLETAQGEADLRLAARRSGADGGHPSVIEGTNVSPGGRGADGANGENGLSAKVVTNGVVLIA